MGTAADLGRRGEDAAAAFLEGKGLRVMDRNYRFGREEVDVVCFEPTPDNQGGMIVFVEVKARSGDGFGAPEAAVDEAKQRAIMRVAEAYLHERRLMPSPVRFDVVAVRFAGGEARIQHFENAFGYFV
jgi:putative endonuclease